MSTSVVEAPVEMSGSTPNEAEMRSGKQFVSSSLRLKQLIEKEDYWGFLEGEEATLYLKLISALSDEEFAALYPKQDYSHFIEVVQPGDSDVKRDRCESCGRWISETGGYRLKGLPGIYHDRFCLEQGIFHKDEPQRGGSKDAHLGSGQLLRSYITELSEKEAASATEGVCAHCGGTLIGCRAGAKYCSPSCRQMVHAKASGTAKKPIKNPIKPGGYPSIDPEVGMSGLAPAISVNSAALESKECLAMGLWARESACQKTKPDLFEGGEGQ